MSPLAGDAATRSPNAGKPAFAHRGVVEGFYGTPWTAEDRAWIVERIGAWGMNRYVYAPKEDPLHRELWRDPYPAAAMREFAALVETGARAGVSVGFALSPGLSMHYAAAKDRDALANKFGAFRDIGASFFCLALDDVPSELAHASDRASFGSLAAAHVEVASGLLEGLGPTSTLWIAPTDYLGVRATDYLAELGEQLPPEIEVAWTGRTVVSPTLAAAEAAARAETLRRPLLAWDNTPVADGPMRPMLHLGPYRGREPALSAHLCGVLLNPMSLARASAPGVLTAARFLEDPHSYDAESAWREALDEIGTGARDALALFAAAHRFSALAPDDRDVRLEERIRELIRCIDAGGDPASTLAGLRDDLESRSEAGPTLREALRDRRLAAELEPWIASHAIETRRMLSAVHGLEAVFGAGSASERSLAFIAMQGGLTQEGLSAKASYGPRRVLYPQLASMRDDAMGFGSDRALFTGCSLADELVELTERVALERLRAG